MTPRSELKHFINFSDYLAIRNRLKFIASYDTNADKNGEYTVRSLYFENYNNKVLAEKALGTDHREKYRIRIYNNNHKLIKLEKKIKKDRFTIKFSKEITKSQCNDLINCSFDFLSHSDTPLFNDFFSKLNNDVLRPRTIIEYKRQAFFYPYGNVRITFDMNIKTALGSVDIFNPKLVHVSSLSQDQIILEVKYDRFLPQIISDCIQLNERRQTSASKYALGRQYI